MDTMDQATFWPQQFAEKLNSGKPFDESRAVRDDPAISKCLILL